MTTAAERLGLEARHAARAGDWRTVNRCARQILRHDKDDPEGHFLAGQAAKAEGRNAAAAKSFSRALRLNAGRYDAAIELADLYVRTRENGAAVQLLRNHERDLGNSPLYLEMAASVYTRLDLHEQALPLYLAACELQPEIERFRAGLAACHVYLGNVDAARRIYAALLERHPAHQRYHFELAQLGTAKDFEHVSRMKAALDSAPRPPGENIFIWYALGKELEDLEAWDEAFDYYERAGNAAREVSGYDVETDMRLIDTLIDVCDASWFAAANSFVQPSDRATPVFIVGLPRSGTTLAERMLASHSAVGSVGETFFLQSALRDASGSSQATTLQAQDVRPAADADAGALASRYFESVAYKLGEEPFFIEKYPENFLYLGFIAKAFPGAKIVHVRRHPLDVCFAMYKQSYFRFAYTLEDVGRFYVAYDRLMRHWHALLGGRLRDVRYEQLVGDPEREIRGLLGYLGLEFEAACLAPEENRTSSRTASKIQVREKIHRRSIDRWKHFERRLAPLRTYLVGQGIEV